MIVFRNLSLCSLLFLVSLLISSWQRAVVSTNPSERPLIINTFSLKIENFKDYTFDESSQQCDQVTIDISKDFIDSNFRIDGGGVLHSPNYKRFSLDSSLAANSRDLFVNSDFNSDDVNVSRTKCKWNLIAPDSYEFIINVVDFEAKQDSKCPDDRLSLKTNSANNNSLLWLNLYDSKNNTSFKYEQPKIDSCAFSIQSFIKINSNTNNLVVEYDSLNSNMNFLLTFKPVLRQTETTSTKSYKTFECNKVTEMKCEIYNLTNSMYTQKTCINKDLICNCISLMPKLDQTNVAALLDTEKLNYLDNCDYLIEKYENYLSALKADSLCSYYLNLNTKCRYDKTNSISLSENSDDYTNILNNKVSPFDISFVPTDSKQKSISHNGQLFQMEQAKLSEQENEELCSNVFRTNEFGWIGTPNFYKKTTDYDQNLNCTYRIWTQLYQSIQLRFSYFNLNSNLDDSTKVRKRSLTRTVDFDYVIIYDGPSENDPILAHFTSNQNDFNKFFNGRTFNSKSNQLFIVFHSSLRSLKQNSFPQLNSKPQLMGFNFTYQIKGYCIEDQLPCNSLYELNCYSPNQTCNDVWDCHNGADERGCGPCKSDQYRCHNHIFCYRLEDRCDGDNQCIDKSDEYNCDKWFCNSNNGTFLCKNGRCVYEQWVCDGTNDCEDGSDEQNCPSTFTSRRVITTAVLGGTLCSLLLVMALGCACKLYTLHTIGYRNNIRLSQTVQSAAAAAAAAAQPLLINNNHLPTIATTSSMATAAASSTDTSETAAPLASANSITTSTTLNSIFANVSTILRRPFSNSDATVNASNLNSSANTNPILSTSSAAAAANDTISNPISNELPLPHHLIAPPTYNQTMGLVDEYERRQLAFIEHVRTILSQQQSGSNGSGGNSSSSTSASNPNGVINLANANNQLSIIPTVTSSSTTVHRVTSGRRHGGSGSGRHRSHHHHHHHQHRSSSNNNPSNGDSAAAASGSGSNQSESTNSGNGSRSHRSHRHHHRHHYSSSQSSSQTSHRHHNQNQTNTLQTNFDANRRGLLQMQTEIANSAAVQDSSSTRPRTSLLNTTSNVASSTSSAMGPGQTENSTNQAATMDSILNKPSSTSMNLRVRLAKLIKDIVVHHGDNIQYVQLADQANNVTNSNNSNTQPISNNLESNTDLPTTSTSNSLNTRNQSSRSLPSSTSSSTLNRNNSSNTDDEPLIKP